MAYAPPTRGDLQAAVLRDLRDPSHVTFTTDEANDYINEGVGWLNRVHPKETVKAINLLDPDTGLPGVPSPFDVSDMLYIFHVEGNISNQPAITIPPTDSTTTTRVGWDHFRDRLYLSTTFVQMLKNWHAAYWDDGDAANLQVWGYGRRDLPDSDDDVMDFIDEQDEYGVRAVARMRGYQRLTQSRALFQQWQMQANNADVSETQLTNLAVTAEQTVNRFERDYYLIRRPVDGYTY